MDIKREIIRRNQADRREIFAAFARSWDRRIAERRRSDLDLVNDWMARFRQARENF